MIYFIAHSEWILQRSRADMARNLNSNFKITSICPLEEYKNNIIESYHDAIDWKIDRTKLLDIRGILELRNFIKNTYIDVYEYTTYFEGLAGHSSMPHKGVSAVEFASKYANKLIELREELKKRAPKDSIFDPPFSTLQVGGIFGGIAHNVIADKCRVEWETRPVIKEDGVFLNQKIDEYADEVLLPEMKKVFQNSKITKGVTLKASGSGLNRQVIHIYRFGNKAIHTNMDTFLFDFIRNTRCYCYKICFFL